MKKGFLLLAALAVLTIAGCGSSEAKTDSTSANAKQPPDSAANHMPPDAKAAAKAGGATGL